MALTIAVKQNPSSTFFFNNVFITTFNFGVDVERSYFFGQFEPENGLKANIVVQQLLDQQCWNVL